MNIGVIGPGDIGEVIVRKLRDADYPVKMANLRVVTIIEISPIGIIDSWRRYRSLGEDRSVPLLMMGNGTVLPPSVSGSVANLWACD
jgi:hypothetical protein